MSNPSAPGGAPSATLGFVKLVVKDLPRMQTFFEKALNYRVSQTIDHSHMTELVLTKGGGAGGTSLVLYYNKDGRDIAVGTAHGPLGFLVRDTDAAYAHLVSEGAVPHRAPQDLGKTRFAFVLTPEGHEIELVSMRP